jgi:hypothetical protein
LALALLAEFRNLSLHSEKEVKQRLSPPLVVVLPLLFTPAEQRRRNWKKTFEWFSGTVLGAAVFIAEFYVYRHP